MENDLRVLKTKKAIREAFIALVEEKGYRHVTVSDITKRAMINRNTFYLHYMDKEDLISSLMEESVARQEEKMGSYASVYAPELSKITAVFRAVLDIIFEEIEFYRILLTDESLRGNINPLRKLWKQGIVRSLPKTLRVSPLALEFACAGSFGVVEQWIIYDTAPIDDTAKVLATLLLRCLQPLEG